MSIRFGGWVIMTGVFLLPAVANSSDIHWDVACTKSDIPKTIDAAALPNADLHYSIRWGALRAGIGSITSESVSNPSAYHYSMRIETTGLTKTLHHYFEQTDSWVDPHTLLPMRYEKKSREPHYQNDDSVVFEPDCHRYARHEHRLDRDVTQDKQDVLPGDTLDILSYLFYLRSIPLKEGTTLEINLMSGDHIYPIQAKVENRLKISSHGKWYECYFIEPHLRDPTLKAKLRQLQVWITADEKRLPVRLRMEINVGHITAELVDKDAVSDTKDSDQ